MPEGDGAEREADVKDGLLRGWKADVGGEGIGVGLRTEDVAELRRSDQLVRSS